MTTEQWDKVDKTMKEFEKYERKVQRYLLFLMGGMGSLSREEKYKRFAEAPDKIQQLEKEGHSGALMKIYQFLYRVGEFKDITLDEAEERRQIDINWKCTVITGNVENWLAAASLYIQEYTRREMIAAKKEKIMKANCVKFAVNLAKAYMIYCKAKKYRRRRKRNDRRK